MSTISASTTSSTAYKVTADTTGTLVLQTGSTPTTAVTIDTAQNVGVGVVPSAWISSVKALEVSAGFLGNTSTTVNFGLNAYVNSSGAWTYKTSAASSYYEQYGGGHAWYKAASGTAGNAISWTQAMTLDASGNLGIGATSPVGKLNIINDSASNSDSSPTSWGTLIGRTTSNSESVGLRVKSGAGISGTTFPSQLISNGANLLEIFTTGASPIVFGTSATERARIDSSGNLSVGQTAANGRAAFRQDSDDKVAFFGNYKSSATSSILGAQYYFSNTYNNTSQAFIHCNDPSADRFIVRSNGGVANYSANNVNLSDERTKTDIQDAGGYLSKICAIPVRTFKYKDQTDDLLNLGVIAQEVEAVAPELVDTSGFGETPEDGVPLKAIYQTDLQYALMKCIQELNAKVEAQAAEIAALKGA